ncbi:hypothetical protein EDD37DRAFT_629554 [Exophiala viscosa]|uniref:uncharacterized protein n=1 Tax=Exophiala viscosa TaxID=2486360 RepID=UPI002190C96E|nr:hypothetical protein EDD37DRAFT_629554 [Exophiala viscosa]
MLLGTWHNIRNALSARYRIFRTLYALAKLIGEDPNALRQAPPQIPLLDDAPDSAIDVQSERCASPKIFPDDSIDLQDEASERASQVYHAALLNGNTLDDILAAFEAEEIASRMKTIRLACPESPSPPQDRDQQDGSIEHKGYHHHSSSIQIAPEKMLMQQKCAEDRVSQLAQTHEENLEEQSQTPDKEIGSRAITVVIGQENDIPTQPKSFHDLTTGSDDQNDDQEKNKRESLTDLKRCPTFVRRHNPSRISKSSLGGDRHSLAVLQERDTRSSPALGPGSPTKRAGMQRRLKVYQDRERSIVA